MQEQALNTQIFSSKESISVQESEINNTPYHSHSFLEFSYIARGSAIHFFQNQSIPVKEGDYFAVNYKEIHKFSPHKTDDFQVINILFKPEFLDVSLKGCRGFQDIVAITNINCNYFNLQATPTSIIYHDGSGEIRALFEKMLSEYKQKRVKYQEILRCYLTELIIATLREIYQTGNEAEYADHTINTILDYINANLAEDIKLKTIGEKLGYHPSYLSTVFSQRLGIPFSKYLQNLRIQKACDLLANSNKSIEEISQECGYSNTKFFRSIFKAKLQMSPSVFRSMSKNVIIL